MRPTSARAIVKWMSVASVLLALLAFEGFSFAQARLVSSRSVSSRKHVTGQSLLRKRGIDLAPAHSAGISPIPPPNTSDSWTGSGDGTSWNNAGNWNNGVPNSSTVDVTIGTTTASVNDNLTASVGNLTLSHSGDNLTIANGIALSVFGSAINNAGTITLGSSNNVTELVVNAANVSLSGGGTLTMSNNVNNYILGAATADTLTNQSTIQGAGHIGNGPLTLVNSGTINANQTAGMTIQASGGVTNTGTIKATGGTLAFVGTTVANTGGTISANGNTLSLTTTTINGGAVTLTGASTLQLNVATIHGGTLTNSATGTIEVLANTNTLGGTINNSAGGVIKIDNGAALSLEAGTYSQLGAVQLNSMNNVTELLVHGNVILSGGTLTMSNNANNYIFGGVTADTLTNQETIQGAGHIGNGQMGLVNSGTINANQTAGMTIQASGGVTNTGTIKATGGTLAFVGTTVANTGGTISANGNTLSLTTTTINGGAVTLTGASTLQLNVATIHGGTLTNSATGTIEVLANTNTLGGTINNSAGGVIKIDNGAALSLEAGTYSQLGTVQLNSMNNVTELLVHGNVILSGGTLTMSNNANNYIFGGVTADTLTNQETIQGAGHIGNGTMTLVNSGTINANQSAGMTIQVSGGVTNTGTIEATGGTLAFVGTTVANTGGTISANGNTLSLTTTTINGGAVTLTGASTLQLNVATIHGGTLTNSATGTIEVLANTNTLGGTINNSAGGVIKIDNGAALSLEAGTYSQLGTVQLNSMNNLTELLVHGNVILSGGTLTMSNNANNYIFGGVTADTLTNQETIQGAGHIGNGQMGLVNSGTINANQSAGIIIQPSSAGFTNTGTLGVSSGVLMQVTGGPFTNFSGSTLTGGTYSVSGTLKIDQLGTAGGEIVTNAAKIILNGTGSSFVDQLSKDALAKLNTTTAAGAFTVSGGRTFTTAGNYSNLGTLTIGSGSAFTVTGTLAQISGSTLSGGTFVLGGNLNLGSGINLTTNSSTLTLQGGTIMSGATNALAGLNKNTKTLTLAGNAKFTTAGNFTNSGTMTVNSGSTLGVTGTLTNLSAGTLTGGTYTVGGTMQLASANGGITTNAANLTLTGTAAKIMDGTSNALAGFNNNKGTFTLASAATLTTASSNFTNSGTVVVSKGTTLTVGGASNSYNQSAGTTTVDGTLVGNGTTGISVTGGKILGAGTLKANVSIGGGGTTPTINIGDAGKAGLLKITGTYSQLSTGAMNVSIGGTTVGTQYSQLQITGAASLGGTLTAVRVNAFTPVVGQTFTALKAASVTGTFSNSTIAINSTEHFVVSYTSTSVVLTVVSGPVRPSGTTAAVATSQMALASTKQAIASAKPIVLSSRLGHKISGGGGPVLVAGLRRAGGHSKAILERAWDRNSVGASPAAPVPTSWKRIPEKLAQAPRPTSVGPMRRTLAASRNWDGMKQSLNLRPTIASPLRFSTNHHVMSARILPRQMLRMPIMKLGR